MNLRQRALAAMNGEEVYPVPHDLFGNCLEGKLMGSLCRHYGLPENDIEGLLKALGAHTRWMSPAYVGPVPETKLYDDGSGAAPIPLGRSIWGTWDGTGSYFDGIERPLQKAETVAEIDAYSWPDPRWFDYNTVGWMPESAGTDWSPAAWAAHNSDCVRIAGHGWLPVFSCIMDLCGMETGLINIAARPDLIEAMVAHIGDFLEGFFSGVGRAYQGHADIMRFGDDFASQREMIISHELWRRYFLPLWKRLFAIAHDHGMKAMMHSCGAVRPVLGDLVDAGLDVFETVQVCSAGMEPEELKREFGNHLVFYGGVEIQSVLSQGTADDVRREVRRLARILGRGGRYILTSAHAMLNDIPPENALAMFEEVRSYVPE